MLIYYKRRVILMLFQSYKSFLTSQFIHDFPSTDGRKGNLHNENRHLAMTLPRKKGKSNTNMLSFTCVHENKILSDTDLNP